jgi:hypothetical protein
MELALSLIALFNAAAPGIATLLMVIKKKDGTISVVQILDEADVTFNANIQQASDWLKSHASSKPKI